MNRQKRYRIKHSERIKEVAALWRARNAHKKKAHNALRRALKSGHIKKPTLCERCGAAPKALNAHHADYSKPLEVLWVCCACHSHIHGVCFGVAKNYARGEKHPSSKLKAAEAVEIYQRVSRGEQKQSLAKEFGVSEKLVRLLMRGEVWKAETNHKL